MRGNAYVCFLFLVVVVFVLFWGFLLGGGGVLTEDPELRQEVQESMNVLSALQGSTRDNLI